MKKLFFAASIALLGACAENHEQQSARDEAPEENRFVQEVFVNNLYEPTELVVLPKDRILFTQRRGGIKLYDIGSDKLSNYDSIPVYFEQEHGLMGVALDPEFDQNSWIYIYYSPAGERPVQRLSRFTFTQSGLTNEKTVLEVDTQRETCCHTGGSVEFGPDGLLYLSTGDDTNPFASNGYAPIDERPDRKYWDGQRTSANTNDLRGKILRIKPLPDGTYMIPTGNLFEDDDPLTRPEIYTMGHRNPYRIAIDPKRGWLFWGDVGPDAGDDGEGRGPRGHDEFNIATEPGYFGWPYFIGDNIPYHDYDFATNESGPLFDPKKPINESPNNTGRRELPPAQPAKIFYPYAKTEIFPQVKGGGRNAMAGPVYYDDMYEGAHKFPAYFNGRVFFFDWMRGFIYSLGLSEDGNITDWYPFMPNLQINNLIDMQFGPDGELYLLEYGTGWFSQNQDAQLSRISYQSGNRPPVLKASVSKSSGAAPLEVVFDATASVDYDNDRLRYRWTIGEERFADSVLTYTFEKEGVYYPELILSDRKGNKVRRQFVIEVGNEPSEVNISLAGNQSFFWPGRELNYKVEVSDLEDGKLGEGISAVDVEFDIQHYQSYDQAESRGHQLPVSSGQTLMESLDCKACHKINEKSIGPSYTQVAERYRSDENAVNYLSRKIIAGGGGVWGEQAMSAHPDLTTEDAEKIVNYILSLADVQEFPLEGRYTVDKASGRYLLRAAYTDKGRGSLKPVETAKMLWLESNKLNASEFDESKDVQARNSDVRSIYDGSWVGYKQIDLTGIESIKLHSRASGPVTVSVRTGSPEGQVIGKLDIPKGKAAENIVIQQTNGYTDIYLTFSSEDKENRLLTISELEFIPKP